MSQNGHSEDRETRSVVCIEHGVRYNPQMSDGCVICRRQAADRDSASQGEGRWGLMTAAVLGVVLVVLFLSASFRSSDPAQAADSPPPRQPRSAVQAFTEQGLDPAPFRGEIEALEKLLYESDPATPSQALAGHIENAAANLAKAVQQKSSPLHGAAVSLRVLNFSGWVGSTVDTGYGGLRLKEAQRRWEANVRDAVFLPADWFHGSVDSQAELQPDR
ncbi:MAG TPA: hypothetical protein VLV83_02840 [Acidobacteriota bacterium]|nr:hypothetical protein [Acidobacteriota bacterium]